MTWLYVVMAGAVAARWGLWYLRDVIEWLETPSRDRVSPAMLARLRLRAGLGTLPADDVPVLELTEETAGGPRSA